MAGSGFSVEDQDIGMESDESEQNDEKGGKGKKGKEKSNRLKNKEAANK